MMGLAPQRAVARDALSRRTSWFTPVQSKLSSLNLHSLGMMQQAQNNVSCTGIKSSIASIASIARD